jgi:hypothetical protein
MKFAIIGTVLALATASPAWADDAQRTQPCVSVSPTLADCRSAMAALKAQPPPPQGIPVQSPTLRAELVAIQQTLLQMQIQQVETNRLLAAMAAPASPSTHTP